MTRVLCAISLLGSHFLVSGQTITGKAVSFDTGVLGELARNELAERRIAGAALAVVQGDRVIWSQGFGVTSSEYPAPVTADTLFMIGSTTKVFTAAAVLDCARNTNTRLDAPLGQLISGLDP